MTDQLFEVPEQLSPRLAWLKTHDVHTEYVEPDMMAHDGGWMAWTGDKKPSEESGRLFFEEGGTEKDAILAMAIEMKIKLWNE